MKLKTNIGTKLSHFDMWHNYEVTRVKNSKKFKKKFKKFKKFKKSKNWHVALTLTLSGQINGKNQIESFLRKWGPNWDNEKLKDQNEISWQIEGPKE